MKMVVAEQYWFEDKHWIDEDNHNIDGYDEGVIAWCEIPTFDKE